VSAICNREDELLEALERGFVGPELDVHSASCTSCSELRLVAGAFLEDRREAMLEAPIPSSGTMLWRMHMRARHDAEATARRSLLIGQAASLLVALTLVAAFFGSDMAFFGSGVAGHLRNLVAAIRVSTPLLLALGMLLLTAPIAGWVAVRSK
jgi:hypothetical protein